MFMPRLYTLLYRGIRYHWLTEFLQNKLRKSTTLRLPEVEMEIEVLPGQIIIDCGANVGQLTSRFARTGAKVYAFEPNPTVFQTLSNRFRKLPFVECLDKGVLDRHCTLILRVPCAHEQWDDLDVTVGSSFHKEGRPEVAVKEYEVTCIELATFIRSLNSRVRLLKMDIEGSEIPVLNKLIDTGVIQKIDHVVVETHEKYMPHLLNDTEALRAKIRDSGLAGQGESQLAVGF